MSDNYENDNIFARIIKGEIPCEKVYEDDYVLAFNDIQAAASVHVLVIPKAPYVSFSDFVDKETPENVSLFFRTVGKVAEKLGLSQGGYRIITNQGDDANQSVHHFHVHILGGQQLGGLLPGDIYSR